MGKQAHLLTDYTWKMKENKKARAFQPGRENSMALLEDVEKDGREDSGGSRGVEEEQSRKKTLRQGTQGQRGTVTMSQLSQ